jgi:hypothetical protein
MANRLLSLGSTVFWPSGQSIEACDSSKYLKNLVPIHKKYIMYPLHRPIVWSNIWNKSLLIGFICFYDKWKWQHSDQTGPKYTIWIFICALIKNIIYEVCIIKLIIITAIMFAFGKATFLHNTLNKIQVNDNAINTNMRKMVIFGLIIKPSPTDFHRTQNIA